MLNLTPGEVVKLAQIINIMPAGVMVMNDDDELTLLEEHPDTKSLIAKVNGEAAREDVQQYLENLTRES